MAIETFWPCLINIECLQIRGVLRGGLPGPGRGGDGGPAAVH